MNNDYKIEARSHYDKILKLKISKIDLGKYKDAITVCAVNGEIYIKDSYNCPIDNFIIRKRNDFEELKPYVIHIVPKGMGVILLIKLSYIEANVKEIVENLNDREDAVFYAAMMKISEKETINKILLNNNVVTEKELLDSENHYYEMLKIRNDAAKKRREEEKKKIDEKREKLKELYQVRDFLKEQQTEELVKALEEKGWEVTLKIKNS